MTPGVIERSGAHEFLLKAATAERPIALTMFSPPYATKWERYEGARVKATWQQWADWLAEIVILACDATHGFVIVIANNPIVNGEELPANDRLRIQLHQSGEVRLERPIIWHKNSTPNTRPWWVNDWEPVMAFYSSNRPRPTTWSWEAVATPPKFATGGHFRQRSQKGERKKGGDYPTGKLARPRDVLRVTVGGGMMGSKLAHENEAPYPERICEPFILALTNPGDIVCDPMAGSGTTLAAAARLGRQWAGCDIRQSQVDLTTRRMKGGEA